VRASIAACARAESSGATICGFPVRASDRLEYFAESDDLGMCVVAATGRPAGARTHEPEDARGRPGTVRVAEHWFVEIEMYFGPRRQSPALGLWVARRDEKECV
jgi:hypothetical protein